MTAAEFAARLDGRPAGNGWMARCPVPSHQDRHPSLSISTGDDDRVLLTCFGGCALEEIVRAVGLSVRDLFAHPQERGGNPATTLATVQHLTGCTLADYAEAKRLPIGVLQAFGVSQITRHSRPAVRFVYRDIDGREAAVRFRWALSESTDGGPRFTWKRGAKVLPYGLDRLAGARAAGVVVLVEGESDAHTLWTHGQPALGLPGASSWRDAWADYLDGIATIYVVIEPDRGGESLLSRLGRSAIRERLQIVRLTPHKDVSALHVCAPDRFAAQWSAALNAAETWTAYTGREERTRATAAWATCARLAQQSNVLACLDDSLTQLGVVGERRAARLVYLATTSRFFARPVSVAVKGPSSGGKSHITERILAHFPQAAYYALTAMSDRALAYSDAPLSHRMMVIYEAVGLQGDFASYLSRSLLSEGRIRYEFVEKTKDGLRPRVIEREGPTGLITTTTAIHLHPENETRLLSVPVTDTHDQTRQILLAQATDRGITSEAHLAEWIAFQEWLAAAEHRVVVPYAKALAERIPPIAIRLRRDFPLVLSLLQAHAVLHQVTRPRDPAGRIVATLEDYAAVRELVVDLLEVAAQATVSDATRATVLAVHTLTHSRDDTVSLNAVASHLGIDKATASRRVKAALADGYLQNRETGRGKAFKLAIGDPLPDHLTLLPTREALEGSCAVAASTGGVTSPLSQPGRDDTALEHGWGTVVAQP